MKFLKRPALVFGAATLLTSWNTSAITITAGNIPQTDENILFNEASLINGPATTVTGIANNSDFTVNFTSGDLLNTPSGGQARVEGAFDDLIISLGDPTGTFTSLILNLAADAKGQVTFNVDYLLGSGGPLSKSFNVTANGQNFFTITANGNERIKSVGIVGQGEVDFKEVSQVRIGGLAGTASVPDGGATAMLLGLGILGMAGLRRKLG